MSKTANYYIGLMSGTSLDGIDAVLTEFGPHTRPRLIASASLSLPTDLRTQLLALNEAGHDELHRAARAANHLVDLYTKASNEVLKRGRILAKQVRAIGAHGQTVRHAPEAGYTIQINAPARLAEQTGIAVIADFRARDIAAGGQGAPLVPAVHQALFSDAHPRIVLNLGGIANITILRPGQTALGFDTGPANMLLDTWIQHCLGQPYDAQGQWAASGRCCPDLLAYLLDSEPWFALPPPKSTGRDRFHLAWLRTRLQVWQDTRPQSILSDQDVQATLCALTVESIKQALQRFANDAQSVLVCGGGAQNQHLMQGLHQALGIRVDTSDTEGIPAQLVEALAFAWLAYAWDQHIPANVPAVTGARGSRILGCRYPA